MVKKSTFVWASSLISPVSAFARVFTQSASVLIRRPSISVPHRAVWWPLTAARLSQPLLSTASCFRFSVKMIYSGLVCHPGLTHSRPSMSVIQCQPRPWWHSFRNSPPSLSDHHRPGFAALRADSCQWIVGPLTSSGHGQQLLQEWMIMTDQWHGYQEAISR